jgi:hypothetical protein
MTDSIDFFVNRDLTKSKDIVAWPEDRYTLLNLLHELSNKAYQQSEWADPNLSCSFGCEFEDVVIILLDDLCLLPDEPFESKVGYLVYNAEEGQAVQAVIAVQTARDTLGFKQPDKAYYNSPLWDEVVRTAKHALETMLKYEPLGTSFRTIILKELLG